MKMYLKTTVLLLLVCVLNVAFCTEESHSSEHEYPIYDLDEECKTQSEATTEDIDRIKNFNLPLTKEGKCLLACIFKKVDILSPKGEYQKDKCAVAIENMLRPHPNALDKAMELLEQCSTEVNGISDDEHGCEKAAAIFTCVSTYIKDNEFDLHSDEEQ